MIHRIPDGSMIGFESNDSLKHFFKKPMHCLIQLFTGSNLHHVGIMHGGYLYEATAKTGVRAIALEYKLGEISKHIRVHVFQPRKKLSLKKQDSLMTDLRKQLGKRYSKSEAFFSVLTAILCLGMMKPNNEKMFCSKLVFYAVRNMYPKKLKRYLPRTMNPEEVKKVLLSVGYLKESYILRG